MSDSNETSLTLRSPEGVALELPVCGPGPRVLAYGIDYLVLFSIGVTVFTFLLLSLPLGEHVLEWLTEFGDAIEENEGDPQAVNALLVPVMIVFLLVGFMGEFFYFTLWELVTGGRSPGKMIVKLRVVGRDGMPADAGSFAMRNLLRIVDVLPGSYAIGLLCILMTERSQRLGDLAAGTVVIRTDGFEPAPAIELPSELAPLSLSRDQLSRLGANELGLARGALRRGDRVGDTRANAVLGEAAEALRRRLELQEEPGETPRSFLQRVVLTGELGARRG